MASLPPHHSELITGRLVVLFGPNSAGKTTVLEAAEQLITRAELRRVDPADLEELAWDWLGDGISERIRHASRVGHYHASDFCCIIGSMASSTMEREETAVRGLFARVDEVLDVAHSIEGERPQEAARLVHASRGALSSAEPVRVPVAAKILLVSDKTVRAWVEEGLLKPQSVRPRLLLDAERLHTVLRFLGDLRAAGQDRDFRDNLWNKLRDEALLDRADLAESLSQMNAGNVRPALTFDEEREERRNRR